MHCIKAVMSIYGVDLLQGFLFTAQTVFHIQQQPVKSAAGGDFSGGNCAGGDKKPVSFLCCHFIFNEIHKRFSNVVNSVLILYKVYSFSGMPPGPVRKKSLPISK